jgi:hypothetical protein
MLDLKIECEQEAEGRWVAEGLQSPPPTVGTLPLRGPRVPGKIRPGPSDVNTKYSGPNTLDGRIRPASYSCPERGSFFERTTQFRETLYKMITRIWYTSL